MRARAGIWSAFALLGGTAFAAVPAQPPPDPATIVLPDMTPTRDPKVIEDGWKHFYFHKPSVGYLEAYADFAECYRYLPAGPVDASLPMFTPWTETPGVVRIQPVNPYGLVGMGIAALISGPIERRARQAPLRRCLETRGYVRYPLAESVWRELIDDYSPRSIALQAKAATLPAPDLPPVTK